MKVTSRNLTSLPDGKHSVGPNLYLLVRGDSRSYVLRYAVGGKRRDKTIGSIRSMTISEAKAKAAEFVRAVKGTGELPETQKDKVIKEIQTPVFEDYAQATVDKLAEVRAWRNAKHKQQWYNTIATYANPVIGRKKLSEITKDDVLKILSPIWHSKNETATRIRGRLENIFQYAVADGFMTFNHALWRGYLDMELAAPSKVKVVEHRAAMPLGVLQEKLHLLLPANTMSKQAILFTILTASRVGESSPAKWSEVDFENRVWSVPPERRKDGRTFPHRVPLSNQAVDLLRSIEPTGEFIFTKKDTLGNRYSLNVMLKKLLGEGYTMHGFRSTFRDWAAEAGVSDTLAEKSLMHATGNAVTQAYQRSDLLEQRREVMQLWADAVYALIS